MDQELDVFRNWVTTAKGAKLTGYSREYVRVLARDGKIQAAKVGRDWLVNKESLLEYQANVKPGRPKEQ